MISQMLAMVRNHDDHGFIQRPTRIEFIEQSTQAPIKIKNVVIVNVGCHLHMTYRQFRLLDCVPAPEY